MTHITGGYFTRPTGPAPAKTAPQTQHTPGPWRAEQRPGHADAARWVITAPTVDRLAVISKRGGAEDDEANARLIAAAPETAADRDKWAAEAMRLKNEIVDVQAVNAKLLEALKAVAACDGQWPDGSSDRAMNMTRAAIKAATEG